MYYIYMLRCIDNSIYIGITTDIKRRMDEHFSKGDKCAKYTQRHTASKLEALWGADNRKDASKLEYHLKTLSKAHKEDIILGKKSIDSLLSSKVECSKYTRILNAE